MRVNGYGQNVIYICVYIKDVMNKIILAISLMFSSIAFAQTGIIEGTIKDTSLDNAPLMFAKVTIKETKESISTGFKGGYFFKDLQPGTYTLVYNFLGYETITKRVDVKAQKIKVDVQLRQSTPTLFEDIQLTSN